jgi:RNA polymerase sigma factor (sigma-70 family)
MEVDLGSVYRTLAKRFRAVDRNDLDDAVATSRAVMWEVRDQGTVVHNAEAYCMTVARRELSREVRRQRRHFYPDQVGPEEWGDIGNANAAVVVIEEPEVQADVNEVLEQAPNLYAEIMRLHYLEGRSLEEIAKHLGITAEAARKRHERALKWARRTFAESSPAKDVKGHVPR